MTRRAIRSLVELRTATRRRRVYIDPSILFDGHAVTARDAAALTGADEGQLREGIGRGVVVGFLDRRTGVHYVDIRELRKIRDVVEDERETSSREYLASIMSGAGATEAARTAVRTGADPVRLSPDAEARVASSRRKAR
jgi:hypothetical protein